MIGHTVSIFLIFFLISKTFGLSTYVCPSNRETSTALYNYRKQLLCSNSTFGCSEKMKGSLEWKFHYAYDKFVLIVHYNQWTLVRKITDTLSQCNLITVNINMADVSYQSLPVCSPDANAVVFTFTNVGLTFVEVQYIKKENYGLPECQRRAIESNSTILNMLVPSCPNTIWVTGNETCNDAAPDRSTVYLRRFDTFPDDKFNNETKNKLIRIGVLGNQPFLTWTKVANETIYKGIVYEMLTKIAANLELKYELIRPVDSSYGIFTNGTWNGLIGMIQRKEVEFVAAQLTLTYERSSAVDFSTPFFYEETAILVRLPEKSSSIFKVLFVFSTYVWAVIGVCSVITACHIYLLLKTIRVDEKFKLSVADCVFFVISTIVDQDDNLLPTKRWSFLIFTITWRLCVYILMSLYVGALVSVLSVISYPLSVTNFQELKWALSNDTYKLCIGQNTALHAAIQNDANLIDLKRWLDKHPQYVTKADECVKIFFNEPNVAVVSEVTYLKLLQKNYCTKYNTILLDDRFFPGYFAFAFPKHSSLNSLISTEIRSVLESGLIDAWQMIYDKTVYCEFIEVGHEIRSIKIEKLKMDDIGVAFVIVSAGCAASFIVFLLEFSVVAMYKRFYGVNDQVIILKKSYE